MTSDEAIKHLDEEGTKALPKNLHDAANNLDWPALHQHVVSRIVEDAKSAPKGATGFYRQLMKPVFLYNEKKRKFSKPDHTVFNALLALTSGAQTPVNNFAVADKMLEEGERRGHGFRGIPLMNEPDFHEWVESLHPHDVPLHGHGEGGIDKGIELFEKYLSKHKRLFAHPGYSSVAGKYTPHNGKVSQVRMRNKWYPLDGGSHGHPEENVWIPQIDASGSLVPKGWTVRGNNVRRSLADLQRIIQHFDGDHAKVSKFLLNPQSDESFQKVVGKVPKKGYYPKGAKVPGMFFAGPKFGPFGLNLSGKLDHMTSDMWHARTMNRYIGMQGVLKGDKGPRTDKERKHFFRAMADASEKLGIPIADVQALLWYHEQKLHQDLGVRLKTTSYADGVKKRLDAAKASKYNLFSGQPEE